MLGVFLKYLTILVMNFLGTLHSERKHVTGVHVIPDVSCEAL
jgi:hypothetical protein